MNALRNGEMREFVFTAQFAKHGIFNMNRFVVTDLIVDGEPEGNQTEIHWPEQMMIRI